MPDSAVSTTTLPPATALLGEGLLVEAIARALTGGDRPHRMDPANLAAFPDDCRLVIAATDRWDTDDYPELRAVCLGRATPWLPVRAELGHVVIGPVELPDTPGCVECAQSRRWRARQHSQAHDAVSERHGQTIKRRPSALLTPLAADLVAAVVKADVTNLAVEGSDLRTRSAMVYVDLSTIEVKVHRFLPDPLCPTCGTRPDDDASSAHIELRPRPKPAPDRYRIRDVADEFATLRLTYVDAVSGIVRGLRRDSQNGIVLAAAPMGLRDGQVEQGYGRSGSYRQSELTAVLEALERYGGLGPGGRRTTVQTSYRAVRDHAVDPRMLGRHSDRAYRQPGFRYQTFDEDERYRWVWGYSFARKEPILVPESYAYYGIPRADTGPGPFAYEVSNGCALGGCIEEAILYGILEVAERDSFLMTWYASMPVPRVAIDSAHDRTSPMMAELIRAETGYQTIIFDTTIEQRIPCVWAMAVDPSDRRDLPKAVCAAGSHLDPERAAENALRELGPILAGLIQTYPGQRIRAREMAENPLLVTEMADHALLYCEPTVFNRLGFLTDSPHVKSFADMATAYPSRYDDLRDDLLELLGRYLETGLDVIVVDQTTPEHRAGGFNCVKVIIPGTLPMTFGHRHRRVDGLDRLYAVPQQLGYRDRRLGPDDINPHPHPFP